MEKTVSRRQSAEQSEHLAADSPQRTHCTLLRLFGPKCRQPVQRMQCIQCTQCAFNGQCRLYAVKLGRFFARIEE